MAISPDFYGAASHLHATAHLPGPFAAGAVVRRLAITASGRVRVEQRTREPLAVLVLLAPLDDSQLNIRAEIPADDDDTEMRQFTFEAFSEAGAFLPLYRPGVDEADRHAAPFELSLTARRIGEGAIPARDVVEVHLLEGLMGRMLLAMQAETPRLRREMRRLAASRDLEHAALDALDRHGADLGVPRFQEDIGVRRGEIITTTAREPDADYRRRLGIYRPMLVSTPEAAARFLNGPGPLDTPAAGALAEMGFDARVRLVEDDDPFAVAIHLVETGESGGREEFLEFVRRIHLILPGSSGDPIHTARYLSSEQHEEVRALRQRLQRLTTAPDDVAYAPGLAAALDRAARCRQALGIGTPWQVFRGQDISQGSRYELGLGADLRPLTDAQLDGLVEAVAERQRRDDNDDLDADTLETIRAMRPVQASADPDGAWFLSACGFRTTHRVSTGRLYVSTLPTFGLIIEGAHETDGDPLPLEARYHAPGDPGRNAALLQALQDAARAWREAGRDAWTSITDDQALDLFDRVRPYGEASDVLRAAGLPVVPNPAATASRLPKVPAELIETLTLPSELAETIREGEADAINPLTDLVGVLRQSGVAAALPLVLDDGHVALVTSAIGLPETGAALTGRRMTGFRWYPVALTGPEPKVKPVGSRTVVEPTGPGLAAVVALGYIRRSGTDPYEVRAELPPEAALSLKQYEFLMNALDHLHPLGVEIRTFGLRQHHVDLGGGLAPLPPSLANTFRPFRSARTDPSSHAD